MSSPDVIRWFDDNWKPLRDRARQSGWDSLARRDQVLVAVGFLVDSCMGDGVTAVVDGVAKGTDDGLTAKLPAALDELGFGAAAEYARAIVRLRTPSGSSATDESNREAATDQWREIRRMFEQRTPDGERLMVARLYEWYKSPAGPSEFGSTEPPPEVPVKASVPIVKTPKAAPKPAPKAAAPKKAPKPAKSAAKKVAKKTPPKPAKKAAPKKPAKKPPVAKKKPAKPVKKAAKKKK